MSAVVPVSVITSVCTACAEEHHAWSDVDGLALDTIVLFRRVCACLCRCSRRKVQVSTPVSWRRDHG